MTPTLCPVHGLPMSPERVRPRYGLPAADPTPFYEAMARDFPHAGVGPLGGCVVPGEGRSWIEQVCPRCVVASKAWRPGTDVRAP